MYFLMERPDDFFGINCLAFSPDGRWLASGSEGYAYDGPRGDVMLWDLEGRRAQTLVLRRACPVRAVTFAPDGQTLVAASGDRALRWWALRDVVEAGPGPKDCKAGRRLGGSRVTSALAYAPDGRTLLTAVGDQSGQQPGGEAQIRDAGTGEVKTTLLQGVAVCAAAYGRLVALGCADGRVVLFEPDGWKELAVLRQQTAVRSLAFSPDGRTLATGAGWSVKVWDVASGEERATLAGHRHMVWSVAFSPDGRALASGGGDGVVRFWDATTGAERASFEWGVGSIRALAFAPDGMTAAVGGHGPNSLVVWDVGE